MRVWLFVSISLLLASCDRRSLEDIRIVDEYSVCRIRFGAFCISSELSAFSLSIQEIDTPTTSAPTVIVTGTHRTDSSRNFSALIAELAAPDLLGGAADCRFNGVLLDDCNPGKLPTVTYRYTSEFDGHPNLSMEKGIRVTLLRQQGVDLDIVKSVAYQCQFMSDGRERCAASLPVCKAGPKWVGCHVDRINRVFTGIRG